MGRRDRSPNGSPPSEKGRQYNGGIGRSLAWTSSTPMETKNRESCRSLLPGSDCTRSLFSSCCYSGRDCIRDRLDAAFTIETLGLFWGGVKKTEDIFCKFRSGGKSNSTVQQAFRRANGTTQYSSPGAKSHCDARASIGYTKPVFDSRTHVGSIVTIPINRFLLTSVSQRSFPFVSCDFY